MSFPPPPSDPSAYTPPPPPAEVTRPETVSRAVMLMWAGAAMSVLNVILAFAQQDQIRELIEEQEPGLTPSEVDTAVAFGVGFAVIGGLIGLTLWAVNAVFCGKGQGWSRILATVLFGLFVFSNLFSVFSPAPLLSRIIQLVYFLIALGAVVLLWLPESSRYFSESGRARQGY